MMDGTTTPTGAVPPTARAYGIDAFLQQADEITWTVLAILVLMSVLSWQAMLYRSLALWWVGWQAKKFLGRFWAKASLAGGAQALSEREQGPCSRLAAIVTTATRHFQQHGGQGLARGLSQADLLTRLLAEGLAAERVRLERGLTLLASVGSTAPFVGLFGTVWGIHHALVRIGATGQATIDQIAGPVGEALIMTAIGLAGCRTGRSRLQRSPAPKRPAAFKPTGVCQRALDLRHHRSAAHTGSAARAIRIGAVSSGGYGMSFGSVDSQSGRPMAEINTTPLVDVMLVLLIIFIITAPLLTHAVRIDLPEAASEPNPEKPETVTLAIDAEGKLYWNDALLAETALPARLEEAAGRTPQPELHLRADKTTIYQRVAEVMSAAQRAGITKLGFVTEPGQP